MREIAEKLERERKIQKQREKEEKAKQILSAKKQKPAVRKKRFSIETLSDNGYFFSEENRLEIASYMMPTTYRTCF